MPALRTSTLILALLGILGAPIVSSLPGDKEQAIHISADQAMRDEKKGLTTYTGSVIFSQGSMRITADKVTVFQSEAGRGKVVAVGQPARMQQRPEIGKELVRAHANILEYYEDEERVHLQSNAKIQQAESIVTGETIDYYISEELVKAGSDETRENSRVNVVIPANMLEKNEDNDGVPESK